MRITEIDQRYRNDFPDGLQSFYLRDLKRIVVVAGPNGAGKTRLFSRINKFIPDLNNFNTRVFSANGIAIINESELLNFGRTGIISFVRAKDPGLRDPYQLSRSDMINSGKDAATLGVEQLSGSSLPYIQTLQDRMWEATHQNSQTSESEKLATIENYNDLCTLVQIILGTPLRRNPDGHATLFGMPMAQASLSDGQQSLLVWAVALHAQGVKLKQAILLMDEPENHLHPEAMILSLRRIIDANSEGQCWIATHSVPLIAFLYQTYSDDITLLFMDKGAVAYAGREPERVLESLMGGAENIEALRQFVDLPEQLAANRFAAESLLPPAVIEKASQDDPQVKLAEQALFPNPQDWPVKLLDFGAGHGRLLDSLAAGVGDAIADRLDYVAFDSQKSPRCIAAIERVYGAGSGTKRFAADLNILAATHKYQTFNVVILCNVLHEIDPLDWLKLFQPTGVISWALSPTGSLVIIEDYLMQKGEYAHSYGFTVLDTAALQALFGHCVKVIPSTGKYAGRIKGHTVPCSALRNVTAQSRLQALGLARQQAQEQIQSLRKSSERSFRSGQAHSFWVQQFTNITLALEHLGQA